MKPFLQRISQEIVKKKIILDHQTLGQQVICQSEPYCRLSISIYCFTTAYLGHFEEISGFELKRGLIF